MLDFCIAAFRVEGNTSSYYISHLGVSHDHRGKGYGRALLQAFLEHVRKKDGRPVTLITLTQGMVCVVIEQLMSSTNLRGVRLPCRCWG